MLSFSPGRRDPPVLIATISSALHRQKGNEISVREDYARYVHRVLLHPGALRHILFPGRV